MLTYVARRVLYSIPVLLVASFLLFVFVRATFDPTVKLRASRDPQAVQRERERLGLDKPVPEQFVKWLGDFVQGDFGHSERTRESVSTMIVRALGYTVQLIFWGVVVSAIIAIAIGVYSASRQYSKLDYTFTGLAFLGLAMPPFWFGLLAMQLLSSGPKQWFGLSEPIFPTIGLHSPGESGINLDYLRHLVLPVMTLTVQIIASWSRYQRASMLDVMSSDYIRTARAKGVPQRRVVFKHGLRNALIPLVTVMSLDIGAVFGGLIITEKIFSVPGMGRLFFDSLLYGDIITLEAWFVVSALFIILFNLIADVLYGVLDPRVRLA
ncbi:MAG: ABC transporter permease [Actinobacteria bacterium]|nr:ABC transporter permease [Actinomycetota bacterium]